MSVEVIDTTDGIASCAVSANDGSSTPPVRGREAAGVASRWASDLGVTLTEEATTMPKTTAAAMRAEKDRARLVVLSIMKRLLLKMPLCGTITERGLPV